MRTQGLGGVLRAGEGERGAERGDRREYVFLPSLAALGVVIQLIRVRSAVPLIAFFIFGTQRVSPRDHPG